MAALQKYKHQKGFTIIEIIIVIILVSLMGTIIMQFMNKSLTDSTKPISMVQRIFSLDSIIEEMTADYNNSSDSDGNHDLPTLKTNIENGYISGNNPYYGQYTQQTSYIKFDSSNNEITDSTGDNNILKAVITANNRSITVLFTE